MITRCGAPVRGGCRYGMGSLSGLSPVERAGAEWLLGRYQDSIGEVMQNACDLGLVRACQEVTRMRARLQYRFKRMKAHRRWWTFIAFG